MPGQRKYGQDHDFYPWSPIVNRPVLQWPGNARVALCVILALEHYDWQLPAEAPGVGYWPDIRNFSRYAYGNRIGVFRVMKLLDKYGIKPTIAMDAATARKCPDIAQEGQKRGAEFIAHGLTVRRPIRAEMSEDEERQYVRESIEAVAEATGQRPVGWCSPGYAESTRTPNVLAAEGIRYVCDWPNDEQPYAMTVKSGALFSLPAQLDLDDVFTHWDNRIPIMRYGSMITEAFDELYRSAEKNGRVLVLNLHPWLIGQPFRSKYLDQALAHITKHDRVWKATGREIVDWYATQIAPARTAAQA